MPEYEDFQEIAHCGGRVTFHIDCDENGNRSYSQGFQHDRPSPASWVGIYALAPHAIPVSDFRIRGIGQGFDPQPQADWFPVFLVLIHDNVGGISARGVGVIFAMGSIRQSIR